MYAAETAEREFVAELTGEAGRRLTSPELHRIALQLFLDHCAEDEPNATGQMLLRIAIKACPYVANIEDILAAGREIARGRIARELPGLTEWAAAVEARQLPLPIVMSCEAYLDKARETARAVTDRYFGVQPVIVTGGDGLVFEHDARGAVLRLPVSDVYEDLPAKVFETWVLFEALGARHGVLKIDDDTRVLPDITADIDEARAVFAQADYMGVAISSPLHDRCWHHGKCATLVSPFYGKPFVAPWARGALYFLSKGALTALTSHYLRFPACLSGELYEDKATADILHALGVSTFDFAIESVFGLDTDAPERGVAAVEH
ncbi:hypothetical protein [Sphingomonas sp. 8AM]|uniref:hypothetical protein n=1 Tax=Sphingomonas sp. 8AM TaxID=2653170 RepID=UPI0012F273F1|nr:hypothetical protein [Sphingomonas sp. 8AM]VXC45409.1 Galactosyltransferase [Sphingomonas sp. 8AM]